MATLFAAYPEISVAQNTARGDTVVFELARPVDQPANFNWYFAGTRREHGAHQAMWEPLFIVNYSTGALEPWLAKEPMKPNAKFDQWRLTLRDDVKWSNGDAFNADDVVFTVDMVRTYDLPAMEAVTLRSQVKGVTKVDAYTVDFDLREPNPRFALENFSAPMFSSFLIMPSRIWKGKDPTTFTFPNPIGTGPYKLKEATDKSVTWVRNDTWWGTKAKPVAKPLPQPLQLVWRVVDSETTSRSLLETNELDAAREYGLATFAAAKANNPKIIGWDEAGGLAWNDPCALQLEVNTQRDPWKDPGLRKALSLSIDRARLAKNVYADTTRPSRTMFAEYGAMKPFIEEVVKAGYGLSATPNLGAAQALLGAAGYQKDADGFYKKAGVRLDANIMANADFPKDVEAVNELKKQLEDAGIGAKVELISKENFWGKAIPKGEFELAYSWLSCGSIAEPYASMSRYAAKAVPIGDRSPGFNNTGRWDSQAAKDYAASVQDIGRRALGDAAVPGLVAKAYAFLDAEMPFVPLVQSPRIIPFNTTYWTGWPVAGGEGVPMHSWAATHNIIHRLRKAK